MSDREEEVRSDSSLTPVRRFRDRARQRIADLLTEELIEEHRVQPAGRRSDALERVLTYFRKAPTAGKYVIVHTRPNEEWRIGVLTGVRGQPPTLLPGEVYHSETQAQHAVLLRRVADLRSLSLQGPGAQTSREDDLSRRRAHQESPDPETALPDPQTVVHGYSDPMSAQPGRAIHFMVHCDGAERYRAQVVRISGPRGDAVRWSSTDVEAPVNGEYPARSQRIRNGSYVYVADPDGVLRLPGSFTLHAIVWPTTPARARQGVLSKLSERLRAGYAMGIDSAGRATAWLGARSGSIIELTGGPLRERAWCSLGVTFDAESGYLVLYQKLLATVGNGRPSTLMGSDSATVIGSEVDREPLLSIARGEDPPFIMAGYAWESDGGRSTVTGHFNGKIASPRVYGRALSLEELDSLSSGHEPVPEQLVARWDFSEQIGPSGVPSDLVTDVVGGVNGRCVNMPARAVTGPGWDGRVTNFVHAPEQYDAIYFHELDLEDAGWEVDCQLVVPQELGSGIYALHLQAKNAEDYVPFVVRQPAGRPTAQVALLIPSATYMAYANHVPMFDAPHFQASAFQTPVLSETDIFLYQHPEYGASTYDLHVDGSGAFYTSRLRPILNMRPGYHDLWGLPADLCLVGWLDHMGYDVDIITDEDLHLEALDLVRPYRVVLTGTHPEYYSEAMLNALESYLVGGGRLMYLGGNGFYWVISYHPDKPHLIEVRKRNGTRSWETPPGEYHHSTTGEPGGLWRGRGRPPQRLVGVGFTAQGMGSSSYYRRMPDSFDARAAFIFEGIGPDERIGGFGLSGGGAAGREIDRYDLLLGTPQEALLLASSEDHSDAYLRAVEEVEVMVPGTNGTQDPMIRADMVYITTRGGGGVFSVGSIAWCASLPENDYKNNVSRITDNVLGRFLSDVPLS